MIVTIRLDYFGGFAEKAGKSSESLDVSSALVEAYASIRTHVERCYNISPPFILMVDNVHIAGALKKRTYINGGEVFKIMPCVSGG